MNFGFEPGRGSLLAHGGHPGPTTTGEYVVMAVGGGLLLIGIALLFLKPSRFQSLAALQKAGVPMVALGFVTATIGPMLLLSSGSNCTRPTTDAKLEIASPGDRQSFTTTQIPVEVRLAGAKLSQSASTKNIANEGHLHLYLDGKLLSMTGTERQTIEVPSGEHELRVEFVANDHAPFCARVRDEVTFHSSAPAYSADGIVALMWSR